MLIKKANAPISMEVEALHVPQNGAWNFYNTSKIKTASLDKTKSIDLGGFDLTAAVKQNPDNLFVKVFAIKANEVNDNGDCFNESELKKAAHTFIGVPVFVNHQNDNVENARGKVVHSWYDDSKKGIYCINMVDRAAYPRLARGIEEKYIIGCFPPDAPVLMHDGSEKPICDIEDGDLVISGKGNICKVLGKRQRGYNYPLYSINIEGIKNPLVCTSHHNIYVYRLPKECACGCGEAIGATVDKRITNQKFNRKFKQGHNPRGCKIQHEYIQKIKACEIEPDDFLIEPKYIDESVHTLTEEQCFLLGLFIAEGSFEKRNGVRKSVIFNFAHTELETLASRCSDLLESVFANHRNAPTTNFYPGSSQTRVCLYGEDVADFFYKYCGEYSDQKKMHADLLKLDKEKTTALLAGYMEGDGWNIKGKVYGISTVSKNLASQLRILFAKIGVRTRFRKQEVKTGYKAKAGGGYTQAYTIEFGLTTANGLRNKLLYKNAKKTKYNAASFHNLDKFVLRKIKSIHEIEYEGVVYDIEVENDHSYCVNHIMVSNTSMGAQVGYSLCSICHNKAHTADEFCPHIKSGKNRKISGKYDCKYHESSSKPEDDCPLDGCKKGHQHELMHKEAKVYEWNFDIKFIEDSFVVNPACHDCLVCDILNVDHIKNKVAENIQQLKKVASSLAETVDTMNDTPLEKTAGKTELQALSQAMNLMEHVARSMMAQKQQIQLDYASDLVEHMAKVQSLLDELTEMGYGQLPSPTDQQVAIGNIMSDATQMPQSSVSQQVMNPAQVGAGSQQQSMQPQTNVATRPVASPAGTSVQGLGELGSITRPTFTGASSKLKKDFLKTAQYVNEKLENVSSELRKSIILLAQRSSQVEESNNVAEYTNGNIRVTVANVEGDGIIVGKWRDNKLVSWSSLEEFGDDIVKLASTNAEEAAKLILNNFIKESGVNMSDNKTTKLAASASQTEFTTQKQLDDAGSLTARTNKEENIITEARLDNKGEIKAVNNTSSDSPQLRTGKAPEVITQAQLEALKSDLARWDSFPEVITEAQWDEMSRRVSSCCNENYTEQITQAQLEGLQKAHKWTAPEVTTQAQLSDQKKVWSETASARTASATHNLVKAATNAIADAIANYNLSPNDIANAVNLINNNPYAQIKAAYLTLVNGSPDKINARIASIDRKNYFAKVASVSDIKPIDAFLAAMGDNVGYNKAEDFVAAVTFAAKNQKVFASAEETAMQKIAQSKDNATNVISREDAFMNAFNDLNRSDDGLYKICGTLQDDIKVDPSDKVAFMKAAHAYASQQINAPFIIANVDLDTDAGVFEIDCKETAVCTNAEKVAYANFVNGLTKVASENTEDDGFTKICGTLTNDILENPSNKVDFMKAAYKFARKHIDKPFVIANIDISDNDNTFEIVCKNKDVCSDAEIQAFAHVMGGVMKTASKNSSENEHDGLYKICGTLTEDVTVDPSDRATFMKSLYTFAKQHIQKPFIIANVEINTENNTFEVDCKEKSFCSNAEKTAFASAIASNFKTAQAIDPNLADEAGEMSDEEGEMSYDVGDEGMETTASSKRSKMIRQAQMMGGELGGGMGGGGPAGGMGATMPGAAGAGAAPGAEALSAPAGMPGQEGAAGDMGGEMGADEDSDMKAKPPGTICPICGSSDVDVIEGKCKCNNCTGEWTVKVNLDITKYPSVLDSGGEGKKEGEEGAGEGFAMPENKEPASMPVAAMTKLNNHMLKVAKANLAEQGKEWSLGIISPYTGNASTMRLDKNRFMCLDTGYPFEIHVAEVNRDGKKAVFAEWRYDTLPLERNCSECNRAKATFNRALTAHGIDEDTFDSMLLSEKGKTILAMKNKGLLKTVKTASSNKVMNELKKVAGFASKFPIETCREKIARKFGENALALSGPCEGNNLADCVCNKLAKANVYANDISIKVASIWANEDQMVNCVEDFVRTKQFNMKEACLVCDQLKTKYAQIEDKIVDSLDDNETAPNDPTKAPTDIKGLPEGDSASESDVADKDFADVDPFAGASDTGAKGGNVTIELPADVVEKIDQAFDKALGESSAGEEHHDMGSADIGKEIGEDAGSELPATDMEAPNMGEIDEVGAAVDSFDKTDMPSTDDVNSKPVAAEQEMKMSSDDAETEEQDNEEENSEDAEDKHEEHETEEEKEVEHADEKPSSEKDEHKEDEKDEHKEDEKQDEDKHEKGPSSVAPDTLHKTGDEEEKEADTVANNFRKGKISATGEINLNLDQVLKVLASQGKQIKQAKEVTLKNVQDSVGKIQDHKTMGHEEKFEMTKPDVPEAGKKALMGGEADAGLDVVTDKPDYDAGGGEMGHEKELGYTSEKTHEMTGGNKGAGNHKASSKARTTILAERIMKNIKTASDSKIENAKPVSEHSEIGKYSDGKDLPKSGNPIKPFESKDIGKTDDNQMMGHEKDTIKDIPKAGKDAPSIPTGGGMNSKYDKNQKNAPEKQTAIKGTVIAGGDAESLAAKKEAATRVAGRKLKEGMISLDKLASEIDKLSRYELSDLKDLETALFGASKKGFDTVAKGTEKPLVISEVSNQRKGGQELQSALQNLFSLHKKNELAKDDPNFELR